MDLAQLARLGRSPSGLTPFGSLPCPTARCPPPGAQQGRKPPRNFPWGDRVDAGPPCALLPLGNQLASKVSWLPPLFPSTLFARPFPWSRRLVASFDQVGPQESKRSSSQTVRDFGLPLQRVARRDCSPENFSGRVSSAEANFHLMRARVFIATRITPPSLRRGNEEES